MTARYVFVCAGALGSTELLLRSRDQYRTLPDLPAGLGEGYSGNGDFLSFGFDLPDAADPVAGPTITTASVVRADTDAGEKWFVIEDGGFSPHASRLVAGLDLATLPAQVARAVTTWGRRASAADASGSAAAVPDRLADRTSRTAVLLAMGRDAADGRIELRRPGHRLRVRWDTPGNDALYAAERAASAELVRALGGRPAVTPTWRLLRQPVTVHSLGGCRIATDPAYGVVDTDGQVFDHPGLYVVDGAALPGATGGNPSLTIAAVAERCLQTAVRRITGNDSWEPPERRDVRRGGIPEDVAVANLRARGPRPSTGAGVVFRETMRGTVGDRAVTMRATVHIADLQGFVEDPRHTAALSGTVQVAGLTSRPTVVREGTLHLLRPAALAGAPAVARRPGRSMDYQLEFTDDAGQRWSLHGHKDVSRRPGAGGPWRATTRLDTVLARLPEPREERGEAPAPHGTITITVPGALRLAVSARAVGLPRGGRAVTAARAAGILLRFGSFFLRHAAEPYLPALPRPSRR